MMNVIWNDVTRYMNLTAWDDRGWQTQQLCLYMTKDPLIQTEIVPQVTLKVSIPKVQLLCSVEQVIYDRV